MADAAAKASAPSDAVEHDGSRRRPPLLGRSPLRVLFRVAQATLLLWAGAILVERYDGTGDESLNAAAQPGDLALGDQVVTDDFDGGDGPLAGDDWQVVAGDWAIQSGEATLLPEQDGSQLASLAVRDLPEGDRVVVQVTVTSGADGVGLVYGYEGPTQFGRVSFNPTFAAIGVERIDGTAAESVARFAPVDIPDSYEVSLEFTADELQLWIGNYTLGQVRLPDGEIPKNFGLSSATGAPVSFDDLRVYVGGP